MCGSSGSGVGCQFCIVSVRDHADGFSGQEGAADVLEFLDVFDGHVMVFGEGVEGKFAGHIGGGGDHGFAAGEGGHFPGQVVGAAQMAGQQADGEAAFLVHDHNARVAGFVDQQWSEDADYNAGGHDADQIVVLVKGFPEGSFEVFFIVEVAGMGGGQAAGQLPAFVGEVKICG